MWRIGFISLLLLSACKVAPKVGICISDPISGGFRCVDKEDQEFFLTYGLSENYVALNPDDAQVLFQYCKDRKGL